MYADDTVMLADTPEQLQSMLDKLHNYCIKNKLTVNASKTKIMIFSRGKCKNKSLNFQYGEETLTIVDEYLYLGVKISFNGRFVKYVANTYTNEIGNNALFSMLRKARNLNIPVDLISELFDSLVTPVLLYGSEIYAPYPYKDIEKVYLKFCKYLLSFPSRTTNNMVYGELGRMPLEIKIKTRAVSFWSKLCTGKQSKLSFLIYLILVCLHEQKLYSSEWIVFIINVLDECGLSNIWQMQHEVNPEWIKRQVELTLQDQFLQKWSQSKCKLYHDIKTSFKFENYLNKLPFKYRKALTKFRTSNHKLPVEKGRHLGIDRNK